MTSNHSIGEKQLYANQKKKFSKQAATNFNTLHPQDLLQIPRQPNLHHRPSPSSYDDVSQQSPHSQKFEQNTRNSKTTSFHAYRESKTPLKTFSQLKEQNNGQKNLKINQLIQQIDNKLSLLSKKYNSNDTRDNTQKIVNQIKIILSNIKAIDLYQNLNQQIAKNKQQIKLLQAENNQLKMKLQKNTFLQKKQLRNFVTKDKYEELKVKLEDVVNKSRKSLQSQSGHQQDIENYIQSKILNENLDLQSQNEATVIAQEVAKIYLELDKIIKDNNLTEIFYPNQLNQIRKNIQMLLDSKMYQKIINKLKLTKVSHILPKLTEVRQAQLHYLYQDIIEKLISQIQKIKDKYASDFQDAMQKIMRLSAQHSSLKIASQRHSSILQKDQKRSRKSTATDDFKLEMEESFNSETIQAYAQKIKDLEESNEKLMKKNQDLEAQISQKSENSQTNYIHELIYQIACFLPLQDIQQTMFLPQTDADCVSMLYQIRFFAKKYEEKQKQMDKKVQEYEKRIVMILRKLIEHYNIPKNEIMAQVNLCSSACNLRNLIHQYYQSKQLSEKRRNNTIFQK